MLFPTLYTTFHFFIYLLVNAALNILRVTIDKASPEEPVMMMICSRNAT